MSSGTIPHTLSDQASIRAPSQAPERRRIPLNFFSIPFGLLGLADAWLVAAKFGLATIAIGNTLMAIAAVVWVIVVVAYLRSLVGRPGGFAADLTDPITSPFASLALIFPMLAIADGIYPHAPGVGRTVVDVLIVAVVLMGGWFTGEWIYRPLSFQTLHPGYFLPTVAGGFVASASAALVGQTSLAEVLFGIGLISWITLGSIVLGRLQLGPALPPALMPTIAIEVAPAGVATFAYFTIHGDRGTEPAALIGGYGILMVLAQLRLLPGYLRLHFVPSFWAFTFSWAAVTFGAMFWLHAGQPTGWKVYSYLMLAGVSGLVGAIAARTIVALRRDEFVPKVEPAEIATSIARTAACNSSTIGGHA